jgi:hypothetical protein
MLRFVEYTTSLVSAILWYTKVVDTTALEPLSQLRCYD